MTTSGVPRPTSAPITPTTSTGPQDPPIFTQVRAEGMTLPVGPISLNGVAVSAADTWLLGGAEFDAEAGVRVAAAWEGELAEAFTVTRLPTLGEEPEGLVRDVTTVDNQVFAAGSGRSDGTTVPVVWRHDPPGRNWQLLALPPEVDGVALEIAGSTSRLAVVVGTETGNSLWISADGGNSWSTAPEFPLADVGVTDVAVMGDLIVVSGAEVEADHLTATIDGTSWAETRVPPGHVTSLASDGIAVVAAGAVGDDDSFPAVRRSTDGATWIESTDFKGDFQPGQLVDITADIDGFVAVSATNVFTSPDGITWDGVPGPSTIIRYTARSADDVIVVGGGDIAVPGRDGWDVTRVGLTSVDSPAATGVARAGRSFIATGRSASVANPVWISTQPDEWLLADSGLELRHVSATADAFVALTPDGLGSAVVSSADGVEWSRLPPPELEEIGIAGLAATDTAPIAFGAGPVGSNRGGVLAVWPDATAPPITIIPNPLIDDEEAFYEIGELCVVDEEHWVAFAVRQTRGGDEPSTATVHAAVTEDSGASWGAASLPHPVRRGAAIDGCAAAGDGSLVVWGSSIDEDGAEWWTFRSSDGLIWEPVATGEDPISLVIPVDDDLIGFGRRGEEVVAWRIAGAELVPLGPTGLESTPRTWATDGSRLLVTGFDSNQVLIYEAAVAGLLEAG